MNSNNNEHFARRIPPHLVPLEDSHRWVMSKVERKWHFLQDHCRFAPIIDVGNRVYLDSTPPETEMCGYCKPKWRRHMKAKPIAL